jgi:hypothetical protein
MPSKIGRPAGADYCRLKRTLTLVCTAMGLPFN